MDVYSNVKRISKMIFISLLVLNLASIAYGSAGISSALSQLCDAAKTFLAAAIMIMIFMAGATYALGQILGAETRARASVWATSMIIGAVIGIVIYILVPMILGTMLSKDIADMCGGIPPK